ncbi:MAG: class I SAM-dependent methyltransferase [Symploca sp. SIO3E6]|nr:class I SAM-dependent methyltransferase [Caldora sp. SIO3E6]
MTIDRIEGLRLLTGDYYLQCHVAFEAASNQQSMILKWLKDNIQLLIPAQKEGKGDVSVLSVGCGSGILDEPFIRIMLKHWSTIAYKGIDPNWEECQAFESRMNEFDSQQVKTRVLCQSLEQFVPDRTYNLVHFIHVLYHFDDVWQAIQSALNFLQPGGTLLIFHTPDNELNSFMKSTQSQLAGYVPLLSSQLKSLLDEHHVSYQMERIKATLDVTECFNLQSPLKEKLLSFIVYADVRQVSKKNQGELLNTLKSFTFRNNDRYHVAHEVDVFRIQKNG